MAEYESALSELSELLIGAVDVAGVVSCISGCVGNHHRANSALRLVGPLFSELRS